MKGRKLLVYLLILFMICGCSGKKEETYDLAGKTYYNTVDAYGNETHSHVWFGKDGSYVFTDNNAEGIRELNGTWSIKENVITLDTSAYSDLGKILFEIQDDETLTLMSTMEGSASGAVFTTDLSRMEKNEAAVPDNTDNKEKEEKDPDPVPETKNIPCTGLTSQYHNYWAIEGVKSFSLEVKASPENTTDTITYSSDDEKIVKVDEKGYVTPLSPGKTKIHVKCGDQSLELGFETRAKGPTSIELEDDDIRFYFGNTAKIKAKALPETADQTLTYEVSDKSIIRVDDSGNITARRPGIAKVTVSGKNGVSAVCDVMVEGETVIFTMEDNRSVKAESGEKIPYSAEWIACYDGNVTSQDVTNEVEFHTAYTSALDIDGHGNVYAKGAIYETTDIPVYFTFSDGSSFNVTSPTYTIRVVK